MQLSQKERSFLEDQKKHEELCIKKYNSYANQARDPQLKQMFQTHAQHEQQHLDSINQILAGQVPSMGGQQQQQQQQQFQSPNLGQVGMVNQQDADLCQDMLDTEKYISHTYDTAIFEMQDSNIRQVLNHIQKEEQQHGEDIFNYMKSKGMYQVQ
ncbi:MAG: spore coat protein [Peptococcaceae bacterium]|jgi:spore coat protein CotF|nr:spore coat protein [Peptococcaceae bacterium]